MKDIPTAATLPMPDVRRATSVGDYVALTKPRLNFLVVATSAAGYYLGGTGSADVVSMAQAVAGTALVAGGAAALNQLYERDTDALMRRTRLRLCAHSRCLPRRALTIGSNLAAISSPSIRSACVRFRRQETRASVQRVSAFGPDAP